MMVIFFLGGRRLSPKLLAMSTRPSSVSVYKLWHSCISMEMRLSTSTPTPPITDLKNPLIKSWCSCL